MDANVENNEADILKKNEKEGRNTHVKEPQVGMYFSLEEEVMEYYTEHAKAVLKLILMDS